MNEIQQTWTKEEIAQLIEYATVMRNDNNDLRAHLMLTEAKLRNEEAKVKLLTQQINILNYEKRNKN